MQHLSAAPIFISAIVPIAGFPNGTKQIESWLSDSALSSFEVLLVIDSDDKVTHLETESICQKLGNLATVKILNSNFRNPGETRNLGLASASGSWIVFWDCDDVPNPSNFLEMVKQAMIKQKDIAIGEFIIQSESKIQVKSFQSDFTKNILENIAINPGIWRFAFKSQLAKSINFPNARMAEDQIYLANILELNSDLFIFKSHVYTYWQYRGNQLTKSAAAINQIVFALDFFVNRFKDKQCTPVLIVIIRLTLSAVKKASFQLKTRAVSKLLLISLRYPRQLPNMFRAVRKILKSK
jgi:glycosyltransferase involved in cell wall biosynthesis